MQSVNKTPYTILVVDDDPEWHDILKLLFTRKGWKTETVLSGAKALEKIVNRNFDVVICDLSMPDMDGLEVLQRVRNIDNRLPFIMMTGIGTIETAVEAVQNGAYSYLSKPVNNKELLELVARAAEHGRLHRQMDNAPECNNGLPMIFGSNAAMRKILSVVGRVASTTVPILIQGETGTGKSLLARYIHQVSARRDKPFLTIDCGALPESLLESELFGHVKGAFTGAVNTRRGLLEEARGGTVFLDEIGEMSPATQVKLLRALQDYEIRQVGSNKSVSIDVRFITATNKNLDQAVQQGTFRKDLYYRLSVMPLYLPPLRERREDLTAFIGFFLNRFNERYGQRVSRVSPAAMNIIYTQPWQGNIRELENTLERAFLLTEGDTLMPESLGAPMEALPGGGDTPALDGPVLLADAVKAAERHALNQALELTSGNKTQAAELLGISRRTLYDKLEQFGMMEGK